eukprot:UN01730
MYEKSRKINETYTKNKCNEKYIYELIETNRAYHQRHGSDSYIDRITPSPGNSVRKDEP